MHMHWCLWMMTWKSFGCVDRSCVENMELCHWVWCGHAIMMWSPISPAAVGGNREPELHLFMQTKFSVTFSPSVRRTSSFSSTYAGQEFLAKVAVDSRSSHRRTKSDAACLHSAVCLRVKTPTHDEWWGVEQPRHLCMNSGRLNQIISWHTLGYWFRG